MFNFKINMYAVYDNLDIIATFNLGTEEMVNDFFTNIAYHLENKKWGSVYPIIMNEFYKGKLEQSHIGVAIDEINDIKRKLKEIDSSKIVCDQKTKTITNLIYKKNYKSLDDIFINVKGEKMTDQILMVLKTVRNKKVPLYIGEYYYKELYNPQLIDIINKTKKKQKLDAIIKYIVYLIIVIIVKLIATEQQFNEFIKKFIFFMIVAELMVLNSKRKINAKIKEKQKQRELMLNDNEPKMIIEKITLERDLRSSYFDSILDEINCPKDFAKIIKTLDAKPIKKWQSDIKNIYSTLEYDIEYANEFIEYLEVNLEQYDTFEYYKIENIYKVIPKEIRYNENDIYRLIKYDNNMNLIVFSINNNN